MSVDVRHRAEAAAVEVGLQARHLNGGLQNGEVLYTRGVDEGLALKGGVRSVAGTG